MALQYTPKSEAQLEEDERIRREQFLWPDGDYGFDVTVASDEVSQKGNEMIHLQLNVFNNEGKTTIVHDYLLPSMEFKLRHAAYSVGLGEKYEDAEPLSAEDFQGRSGVVRLKTEPASTGKDGRNYAAKNSVDDYVLTSAQAVQRTSAKTAAAPEVELDDSIPF